MDRNTYPTGWNKQRVQEVIAHLETRTEEETIAEDEAAFEQDYTGDAGAPQTRAGRAPTHRPDGVAGSFPRVADKQ